MRKTWCTFYTLSLSLLLSTSCSKEIIGSSQGTAGSVASFSDNPIPSLSTSELSPSNAPSFLATLSFDREMDTSTLSTSDLNLNNASANSLSCSGIPTVCTFNIVPIADGLVTAELPAATAQALNGANNLASNQISIMSDTTPPIGPISSTLLPSNPSNDTGADLEIDCGNDAANGTVVVTTNPAFGFSPHYNTPLNLNNTGSITLNDINWINGSYQVNVFCHDAVGNGPTSPATPLSVTIDSNTPTVLLSTTATSPTNASPIPVIASFSEEMVPGSITPADFSVTNAVINNLSCGGNPSSCSLDLTPLNEGIFSIQLPANSTTDLSGNPNPNSNILSLVRDTTAPTGPITAVTNPASPTGNTGADLIVDCGLDSANGTVVVTTNPANGFSPNYNTPENLDANGQLTLASITWAPGSYDILVNCSDAAGNGPTSPTTPPTVVIDTTQPSVVLSSTESSPTNANPIPVAAAFSKDMDLSTIALSDFTLGNATASNLNCSGSPTTCTFDLTPLSDGTVTVDLAAGLSTDTLGNSNLIANQLSLISDTIAPTGPITAVTNPASPTSNTGADLIINCGLDSANGTVVVTTNPANGFSPNYNTPENLDANGQLTLASITWAPGSYDILVNCSDAAGNGPTSPTTPPTVIIDNGTPGVILSSTESSPTNANPIPVAAAFSKDMDLSTIALSDFTLGNATASNLNCSGSPTTCTFDLTPLSDGTVTVDLAAGLSTDTLGNNNSAANQLSLISDTIAPTGPITAVTNPASPTSNTGADLIVDCGLDSANGTVVVTTNPANGFSPNYNTPENLDANGQLTLASITWAPGSYDILVNCSDAAGNGPTSPTTPPTVVIDTTQPSVVLSSTESSPTNANPIPVAAAFSKDMDLSTIALSDFTLGNATASNLNCSGSPTTCTFDLTPLSDGTVTVDLAAGLSTDTLGNNNLIANQLSLISDTSGPSINITGPVSGSFINASNASSYPVSGSCSEINEDVTLNGGPGTTLLGQPITVTCAFGGTWSANLNFTGNTDGTMNVLASHSDISGNTAQDTESFILDTIAPTGPITAVTNPASPTGNTGADLIVDCGLDSANGTVVVTTNPANGFSPNYNTPENLDANGQLTLASITWAPGSYDILVNCSDAAGNGPTSPTTPPTVVIDTTQPSVVLSSTESSPTNANPIPVAAAFSKDMDLSTIALSDFTLGNATASNLNCSGSPTTCTFDLTPLSDGTVTVDLAAGLSTDTLGNSNLIANQLSLISDSSGLLAECISVEYDDGSGYYYYDVFVLGGNSCQGATELEVHIDGGYDYAESPCSSWPGFSYMSSGVYGTTVDIYNKDTGTVLETIDCANQASSQPLSHAINQQASQADPTQSLPIYFDLHFTHPIDPASFNVSDIIETGSADGITWSITNSGDNKNFVLTATAVTTEGFLIPNISAGSVTSADGSRSNSGTLIGGDNSVYYGSYGPAPVISLHTPSSSPGTSNQPVFKLEHPTASSGDLYVNGTTLSLHKTSNCNDTALSSTLLSANSPSALLQDTSGLVNFQTQNYYGLAEKNGVKQCSALAARYTYENFSAPLTACPGVNIALKFFTDNSITGTHGICTTNDYSTLSNCSDDGFFDEDCFYNGDGSIADPFVICSFEQLQELRDGNTSENYILGRTLNANASPSGSNPNTWNGGNGMKSIKANYFNGNGYHIQNLVMDHGADSKALFSQIGCGISNLSLDNVDINSTAARQDHSAVLLSNGMNKSIVGVQVDANSSVQGKGYTGALVGNAMSAKLIMLENYSPVNATEGYVGGIAGLASSAILRRLANHGSVYSSGGKYVGGLVGQATTLSGKLDSFNCGNITGFETVGGIFGSITGSDTYYGGSLSNFYNSGVVRMTNTASNASTRGVNGIGSCTSCEIKQAYSVGNVYTAGSARHNAFATGTSMTVQDAFWSNATHGPSQGCSATSLTGVCQATSASAMYGTGFNSLTSAADWNFSTIWMPMSGYPRLRGEF